MTFQEKLEWGKAKVRSIYHRDDPDQAAAKNALADFRRESEEEPAPVSEEAPQDEAESVEERREESEEEESGGGSDDDDVSDDEESFDETTERLLKNPDPYVLKKYLAELKAFEPEEDEQEENVAENIRHIESALQQFQGGGGEGRMIPGSNVRQNVFVYVDGKRQTPVRYHLRRTPKGRYARVKHHTRHFSSHKVKRRGY